MLECRASRELPHKRLPPGMSTPTVGRVSPPSFNRLAAADAVPPTLGGGRVQPHILILVLSLSVSPGIAFAQWRPDGIPICAAANGQLRPAIVSDGSGGAIIAWTDARDGLMDIYAQRVDALGNPEWRDDGVVVCNAAYDQDWVMLVSDGAGGAIAVWGDHRNFPYRNDLGAQRINALGVPQWTPNGIAVCIDPGRPGGEFSVVSDGVGGAIVAWADTRRRSFADIYAQRIDASGALQWISSGVALCTAPDLQHYPQIVSDDAEGGIVAWFDFRSGISYDVYAQRVDASGATRWAFDGVPLCVGTLAQIPFQLDPFIVADGTGGAIVVWPDRRRQREVDDIFAQRVNAAGIPVWTANGIAVALSTGGQWMPTLASDEAGGAIVAWKDSRDERATSVYAQRVSASGIPAWTPGGVIISSTSGLTARHRVISDGGGGAIVIWSPFAVEYDFDIHAQRVDDSGTPQWAEGGIVVCDVRDRQFDPAIVSDGVQGAIVTWADNRKHRSDFDTYTNIYAQRIPSPARGEIIGPAGLAMAKTPSFDASISQNYPNPFNPATTIDITIAERSEVIVAIYDARGARVATLNVGVKDAGTHRVEWNGTDNEGKRVGTGVYFYRLEGTVASKKMVLLK